MVWDWFNFGIGVCGGALVVFGAWMIYHALKDLAKALKSEYDFSLPRGGQCKYCGRICRDLEKHMTWAQITGDKKHRIKNTG